MLEKFRNFMIESANIMFDDTKNDLRSLPKAVRLQILIVLSFVSGPCKRCDRGLSHFFSRGDFSVNYT